MTDDEPALSQGPADFLRAEAMYEQYWQLSKPAFDNNFGPEFFYAARSHQGALLKLRYVVENRKGLGLLVGEHGLGKTYLTHVLEHRLDGPFGPVVRLTFPQLSPQEMLRFVAYRFDSTWNGASEGNDVALARLERRLRELAEEGREPVLVVDDAHQLSLEHLQVLQLILQLPPVNSGFSMLLVGRSDLLPRVDRLPALACRVAVRTTLQPLTREETRPYIQHRLEAAGLREPVLSEAAMSMLWDRSHGVPRRLNQLCDLSLLVGYADGLTSLSPVEVEAAAEELCTVSAD
jgi:general secretion pathway protein A